MLEAAQIKMLLVKASPALAAMIHLGINCGFGNSDVAALPITAVDLKSSWVEFPRPKTQIPRRCRLWPETVKSIKAWLGKRPEAKRSTEADLLFITRCGDRWVRFRKAERKLTVADSDGAEARTEPVKGSWIDSIALEFGKLLVKNECHRPGLGFYALRHTFETIGGESRDQIAVDAIMGHAPLSDDMSAVYRERISDERLQAVTDRIRKWLFGGTLRTRKSKLARARQANNQESH
jgi:integrase